MAKKVIEIPLPLKGVNQVVSREKQDTGNCWDALNVLPFDSYGRARVAQRFGVSKAWTTALGSTIVQGMLPVHFISYPSTLGGTSTGGFPLTNVPVSTGFLSDVNCTWTSPQIPFDSTATGGRLGNGTPPNGTRPGWGPGGPGGGGIGGVFGGGSAGSGWTLTAQVKTPGTGMHFSGYVKYIDAVNNQIGVTFSGEGVGYVSPGFSTSGPGNIVIVNGIPGPIGSASTLVVSYNMSITPGSGSTTSATGTVVLKHGSTTITSTFNGTYPFQFVSPMRCETNLFVPPSTALAPGSYEVSLG